jgi:hypothetical protein
MSLDGELHRNDGRERRANATDLGRSENHRASRLAVVHLRRVLSGTVVDLDAVGADDHCRQG